jgi:hypothetical protein
MFSTVEKDQYFELKALHQPRVAQHPLMNAILSGVQKGLVYANPKTSAVFICARAGFCLLSVADEPPVAFNADFWRFLQGNDEIPSYVHIYNPPRSLETYIREQCDKHKLRRRVQFRCYRSVPGYDYEVLLPAEHRITPIQAVGINRLEQAFKPRFCERYWDSAEDFLTKAIGVCIVDRNDFPLAICYSASVVDGVAEMDTFVTPEHRGRKFMRIVSEPFFNLALVAGLISHWDTFVSNVPSYVLAEKFGLSRVHEYDLLSVVLR